MTTALDLDLVRTHFPAFDNAAPAFFENAGGSFPCRQTVDALTRYYTETKVQPYAAYAESATAGELMDASQRRWAEALGVATAEVSFGPSTSQNTYVIADAFGQKLGPAAEVVVTNQDHEANTGAVRRMAERVGATVKEWRIDPSTGLLDPAALDDLLTDRTRLVCFPHCSNIVGQENDVAAITEAAHAAGARVICDGVSFAPHGLPDIGALGADLYLFSLYKVYSVHQGLMVAQNGVLDELPNQGHYFNAEYPDKRLTPAGPDHAQIASAGAVLDYIETSFAEHGGTGDLATACRTMATRWQDHETVLLEPVLEFLAQSPSVRLLGPASTDQPTGHRCPTVAFSPVEQEPESVAQQLVDLGIMTSHGTFYADRVLQGLDIDPARGVVRVSWVHYTSPADIEKLLAALDDVLG
ncbi:MAG: aminotransferase class V-fold PLP-dependent enzyme [Acidimicrobiales bacterium]|nr:aminotransferase class V-fold PLP-dependent enzyme [Acidimicrobiales bacterium]